MACHLAGFVFAVLVVYSSAIATVEMPVCGNNDACATDKVCVDKECVDPCVGACGPNSTCHVVNHVTMCSCTPGHSGDPIRGCSASPNPIGVSNCTVHCPVSKECVQPKADEHSKGLCGNNTNCTVPHQVQPCVCKEGNTSIPSPGLLPQRSRTWHFIPEGKKQFYVEMSKTANWQGAFLNCLRNKSRLASVESMEEMADIREKINKTGLRFQRFWTSGTDYGYEGHFVWATSGTPLSSTSDLWLRYEPNSVQNNENCVDVYERPSEEGYGLNDMDCSIEVYYICEYYK